MTTTVAQLVDDAGRILKLYGEGQVLRPEHSAELTRAYTHLHAEYEQYNKVYWGSTDAIPNAYAHHLAVRVAFSRATEFGLSDNDFAKLAQEDAIAERRINALAEVQNQGPTKIQNF